MSCYPLEKELALYAAGVLDEEGQTQVKQHVSACQRCAQRVREYEKICAAQMTAARETQDLRLQPRPRVSVSAKDWLGSNSRRLARWLVPAAGLGAAAVYFLLMQAPVTHETTAERTRTARPETSARSAVTLATLASYRSALAGEGDASLESALDRDADLLLRPTSASEMAALAKSVF